MLIYQRDTLGNFENNILDISILCHGRFIIIIIIPLFVYESNDRAITRVLKCTY